MSKIDFETLVSGLCALAVCVLTGAYLACCLMCGLAKSVETQGGAAAPYSVCECCGQALDGTNDVCVAEGRAEGSGR